MSKTFYFILHTTTGGNVGEIEAADEEEAKKKLGEIYGDFIHDPKIETVSVEFVNKGRHDTEAKRIEKARFEEANKVAEE